MLHRIVALLFALADLAESAACKSSAIRRLVLWVLYPAESVARGMVLASCGAAPIPAARTFLSDGRPEDALRLAACLRLLAYMLQALEDWDFGCLPMPDIDDCESRRILFATLASRSAGDVDRVRTYPDTS